MYTTDRQRSMILILQVLYYSSTIRTTVLRKSFVVLPCSLPGPCARIPAKCPQVIVFAFTWDFWFKIPSTRVGAFVCEGADPYDEVSKGVGSALCRRLRAQDP